MDVATWLFTAEQIAINAVVGGVAIFTAWIGWKYIARTMLGHNMKHVSQKKRNGRMGWK